MLVFRRTISGRHFPGFAAKSVIRARIADGRHAGTELVKLARREAQTLKLLCERGLSHKEIAASLEISPATVKQYISGMCRVLGLANDKQLIVWGYQHAGAFLGAFESIGLHDPGCTCKAIYCRAMRIAREAVEEQAA